MRIEGSQGGGWLQVEFLKCSISEMTNSLFEMRETKTEREREHHKEMERECLLVVLSEQRAGTSLFPRSYSILDESC